MKESFYRNMMASDMPNFLIILNTNIIKGDEEQTETETQLKVFSEHCDHETLLEGFKDTFNDSFVHNVVNFHESIDILETLLDLCPALTLTKRTGRFAGQTALHIVIAKGNLDAAKVILNAAKKKGNLPILLHAKAKNSISSNTAMMGELALSMAALTLNIEMVDLLIKFKARISEQSSLKDNVFHSLIRCAKVHPEKVDSIIEMIDHINKKLPDDQVSNVWYNAENMDNLTPLKFAAALGQVEIFSKILSLENVYCKRNNYNRLFDIYLFDITEIDTITQAEWERNRERERMKVQKSKKDSIEQPKEEDMIQSQSRYPALHHEYPAVLDIICSLPSKTAFQLMNVEVVKDIIIAKWSHYRKFYYLWFLWHFLMLSLITVYAVFKTKVINDRIYSTSNSTQSDSYDTTQHTETFVYVMSCLSVLYAVPYLVYEGFRIFYFKQPWHFKVIHHNGVYRLMLVAMSISLVVDAVWFWIKPDNNYFMVVALLIGWTFMNFFLRALKIFSFFTVMLQKVLLGDMTRFSVIIIFQLVAYSIAMYITFLNTRPIPSGFENLGNSMMTLFKLMLGLTDIEILYDARHPVMAVFLFISFVLITYVLLINSLIALMSQTCALVSEDKTKRWELQILSVLHLVETMLLPMWRYQHKLDLEEGRYDIDEQSPERRYFNEITSFKTEPTDDYGGHLWRFINRDKGIHKRTPIITYQCKRTQTVKKKWNEPDDNPQIMNVTATSQSTSHSLGNLELTSIPLPTLPGASTI